ncbi:MAG: NusG domain II-containing protein [Pseudomonadota bacterium]|nr:NusG domain II-containing protein [Pseudomonadota bacterium]
MTTLRLFKTGDWMMLLAVVLAVGWLCANLWQRGAGKSVIVRSKGIVVSELSLQRNRSVTIAGPLGKTTVEVNGQRARIARDPSPKQYCVRQGWLKAAGDVALCLPNQVSIEIAGANPYVDSINY